MTVKGDPAAPDTAPAGDRPLVRFRVVAIGLLTLLVLAFALISSAVVVALGWLAVLLAYAACVPFLRGAERAELALVTVLALFVSSAFTRLPGINTVALVGIAVAVGGIGAIAMIGSPVIRPQRGVAVLVVLMVGLAASTAVQGGAEAVLRMTAVVIVPASICFGLVSHIPAAGIRRVTLFVVWLGLVQTGVALAEVLVLKRQLGPAAQLDDLGEQKHLLNELIGGGLERAQGTVGHPLALAFLLVVAIALVLRVPGLSLPRSWIAVGVLACGVLLAGSRSAAVLVVLLVLFCPRVKLTLARFIASALSVVLVSLVLVSSGFDFGRVLGDFTGTGSYTHRVGALDAAVRLWSTQGVLPTFLGNGYGSTSELFSAGILQSDGLEAVDNQVVLMLAQGGLLAGACFVAFCLYSVLAGDWRFRGAAAAVALNSLVFDWVNWPSTAALGFFVCAAALGRPYPPSPTEGDTTDGEHDHPALEVEPPSIAAW